MRNANRFYSLILHAYLGTLREPQQRQACLRWSFHAPITKSDEHQSMARPRLSSSVCIRQRDVDAHVLFVRVRRARCVGCRLWSGKGDSKATFSTSKSFYVEKEHVQSQGQTKRPQSILPITRIKISAHTSPVRHPAIESIDSSLANSLKRKGAFKQADAIRLKELLTQLNERQVQHRKVQEQQRALTKQIEECMQNAKSLKGQEKEAKVTEGKRLIEQGKLLKQDLDKSDSSAIAEEVAKIQARMPNDTHVDVPIGAESKAKIVAYGGKLDLLPERIRSTYTSTVVGKTIGEVDETSDQSAPDAARDHVALSQQLGWYDPASSLHVSGPSWPFLVGPLAMLEHALVNYAMDAGIRSGYMPVCVPDVAKREILSRTGFAPRDDEAGQTYWLHADNRQTYRAVASSANDLALAATAEITLAGFLSGSRVSSSNIPLRLMASSHAFRAEAGARGQESRGLYRVHQFTKVELFIVCSEVQSDEQLHGLRTLQESIVNPLGVPYRVLDMPTEELGASAYRKYDVEAWMPGRGSWGEISSTSNCTDYQARALQIRIEDSSAGKAGSLGFAHTLNGTAIAVPRMIVALLENYGVSPSSNKLRLPNALKPYWPQADVDNVEWLDLGSFGATTGAVPVKSAEGEDGGSKAKSNSALGQMLGRVRLVAQRNGSDPASMVASFMILHELTAIVPLIFLFYLLGLLGTGEAVMQWLLDASTTTKGEEALQRQSSTANIRVWLGDYIKEGMQRAERYGRRKGYFGFEKGTLAQTVDDDQTTPNAQALAGTFANAVAAYAIVKFLLPVRLAACFALTAPFARICFEPLKRLARRVRPAKRA